MGYFPAWQSNLPGSDAQSFECYLHQLVWDQDIDESCSDWLPDCLQYAVRLASVCLAPANKHGSSVADIPQPDQLLTLVLTLTDTLT